jgi:hypothetical protein
MSRKSILGFTSFIVLFLLACNATFNFGHPTPTTLPPAAAPTSTSVPLSQQVTLVSQPYIESHQSPPFSITAQTPQLSGSEDPRVQAFNQRLVELVQGEVTAFRESFLQNPDPPMTGGSFLEVTYSLISQYDDIWSLKFDFLYYSDGAAHPGDHSMTLNYDLGQGREFALADLFLPNSNYLEVIANYCITELSKQPFFDGAFTDGANPTSENYRNWNIAPEGLMITFDTYQVGPGAAGPQRVVVPYDQLSGVIDPQGPLRSLIQ